MTTVSVVIPTHNRAAFLPDAIHSVLKQTASPLELVVVDDGSTDATRDLVTDLRDARVRYLYQEHAGVSAALNQGWRQAKGEWVARLDSDDCWRPEFLEVIMQLARANPNCALAYARAQWMDISGNPRAQILGTREKFPGQTLKSILYGDFIAPMAVVIRRTALERVGGYDESLIANEDWDLWIRLAELGPFVYVDRVLADYRVHSQNLSSSRGQQNARLIEDRKRVLDKYYARQDLPPDAVQVKPLAFQHLYEDIGMRHLEAHRWQAALESFGSAVKAAPNSGTAIGRIFRNIAFAISLGNTSIGTRIGEAWMRRGNK